MSPDAPTAIADYGAIGDCRTVALVSRHGSIDWWCTPEFASPSCFAALLDRRRGGRFALAPGRVQQATQHYLDGTNVLATRFDCAGGVLELLDCMAVAGGQEGTPPQAIVRVARCLAGEVTLECLVDARPDYARAAPKLKRCADNRWTITGGGLDAQLGTTFSLAPRADGALAGTTRLAAGEMQAALLIADGPKTLKRDLRAHADSWLNEAVRFWRGWSDRCEYEGDYKDGVVRSALALKLLTHWPTGAVVAAPTTSLPESETGARNWDYRYCWLRDTSLVLHAFTDLGYVTESRDFQAWLLHATRATQPRLQVLYGVHGETRLDETVLPHLAGYQGIGPVRIGNAAAQQVQHDIYGEVILTTCDELDLGGTLNDQEKDLLAGLVDTVCRIWREPDHGIWEIRLPPRHNTHSKLMCWAALDRAMAMHRHHGLPIDLARVERERDAIRADIEAHAWSRRARCYAGYYGSDAPDASLLLMPHLRYTAPNAPRMRATVDTIMRELAAGPLLYRYPPGPRYDGVEGAEHLFAICSFWCVNCLARQGRLDEATAMYEGLLALRTPLGLYSEEYRADGTPMGNFPQAFSHVGSITAALALMRARRHGKVDAYW